MNRLPPNASWFIAIYFQDFLAQVYAAYHPEVAGQPFVMVRQCVDSHKSTVVALSSEAHGRGIYYGFPVIRLKERFSDIVIVQENPDLAATMIDDCATVLRMYSPDVRVLPQGNAIVNVSGMQRLLKDRFEKLPGDIQKDVQKTLGIRYCSCGAAASEYLATMTARSAAPDGVTICRSGSEMAMLAPLSISKLPGLSDKMKQQLESYNIKCVKDIQVLSYAFLKARFGEEGVQLFNMAQGIFIDKRIKMQQCDVEASKTLLRDVNDSDLIKSRYVRSCVDNVVYQLRTKNMQSIGITLVITYSDNKKIQRSQQLVTQSHDFESLYKISVLLFDNACTRRIAIRRITVSVKCCNEAESQLDLFDAGIKIKQENIAKSISKVRERMGFAMVTNGNNVSG